MRRKRNHPLVALVAWLGVSLAAAVLALVMALRTPPSAEQLNAAHIDGMALGQQMCLGLRPEPSRQPQPAARVPAASTGRDLL